MPPPESNNVVEAWLKESVLAAHVAEPAPEIVKFTFCPHAQAPVLLNEALPPVIVICLVVFALPLTVPTTVIDPLLMLKFWTPPLPLKFTLPPTAREFAPAITKFVFFPPFPTIKLLHVAAELIVIVLAAPPVLF